jgi:hypothetical protein
MRSWGEESGWSLRRKQGVDEKLKAGTAEERGEGAGGPGGR